MLPPRIKPKRPILRSMNPVMLPATQQIRDAVTHNASSPFRCWGPAWDRSCKVCAPLPTGGETCSSFKVNDIPAPSSGNGMLRNPAHAVGDEWWEHYSDPWAWVTFDEPAGYVQWAAYADIQKRECAFNIPVSIAYKRMGRKTNGKWYLCTWQRNGSPCGGISPETESWSLISCVEQPSVPGGAVQFHHPGQGYATPQTPPYVPSRDAPRLSFFQRLAARIRG